MNEMYICNAPQKSMQQKSKSSSKVQASIWLLVHIHSLSFRPLVKAVCLFQLLDFGLQEASQELKQTVP
jgi:hypothetical protein